MKLISGDIYGLLVSQGIANGRTAIRDVHGIGAGLREGADRPATVQPVGGYREPMGMKERGAADDGARSQLRQREEAADLNSGKDRGNVAPAKFTVLTCKAPNAHGRRKKAPGTYLRLVWSR